MSTEKSNLHQAARDYALAGIPVFPCLAGAKAPATPNGFKDATTDLGQIDAWWTENPNYNVAVEPEQAGWAVIDLDATVGNESWASLVAAHPDTPDTYEVATPRKPGRHLYFAGSVPPSASKLAEKVDTRGRGSYVLLPPSYIAEQDASYEISHDREVAPLPLWINELLGRTREKAEALVGEVDLPVNVQRAKTFLSDYVERGHIAVEGEGGDARTYQVCAETLNFGLSEETALDLIADHWNPHCIPPWTRDELAVKVGNASQYAQNAVGALASPPVEQMFGAALDKLRAEQKSAGGARSKFYPYKLAEIPASLVEPSWLIPGLVQARGITQIVGQQKSFKTFLTLDMSLGLAAAEETFGFKPLAQVPVVYAVGENASALGLHHIHAWRMVKQREDDFPFHLVTAVPRAAANEETNELIEQIIKHGIKPKLVVIDTATRAMRGLDENSAKDAGIFSQAMDNIREALDCAVLVIRHTGKDREKGGRGSNVIDGDFDGTLEVVRAEKTMAVEVRVKEMRNAAEREYPYTFQGEKFGASLIFKPTSAATHAALTTMNDIFSPKKVGRALADLNAYGIEHGVTSHVLAGVLVPEVATDSAEERQKTLEAAARQLRSLAKAKLQGFTERLGRDLIWCLPVASAPGEEQF